MHPVHSLAIALASLAMLLPAVAGAQRATPDSARASDSRGAVRPPGVPDAVRRGDRATAPGVVTNRDAAVTIVLVPILPDAPAGTRAVVLRRAALAPHNVILVTRATTAADLTRAVAVLHDSRRSQGDAPRHDLMARIAPDQPSSTAGRARAAPAATRSNNFAQAERVLANLPRSQRVLIDGVGAHPARTIRLGALRR